MRKQQCTFTPIMDIYTSIYTHTHTHTPPHTHTHIYTNITLMPRAHTGAHSNQQCNNGHLATGQQHFHKKREEKPKKERLICSRLQNLHQGLHIYI